MDLEPIILYQLFTYMELIWISHYTLTESIFDLIGAKFMTHP